MDSPFFLFFIHIEQTVWSSSELLPFPEGKGFFFCEAEYARLGSPAIFKISPLVSPDFDYLLENRNYEIQHTTNVMAASLDGADLSAPCDR